VGVLFSGDEEVGARCTSAFVASERIRGIERALVCEPTSRKVGIRHRGARAYRAHMRGRGGHSSRADHMPKPVATLARLATGLDDLGVEYLAQGPDDMKGLCMNVATLQGGVAFNVVPDSASLVWSLRPPPGCDVDAVDKRIDALVTALNRRDSAEISWETFIAAPPFACGDTTWFEDVLGGHAAGFVPLDFWTEAAFFQAAGIDAVVVGPGDIGHAHAPDEHVTLADLQWAIDLFTHVLARHAS
jgi:acetylornithine deacetylase